MAKKSDYKTSVEENEDDLLLYWSSDAQRVIDACKGINSGRMTIRDFLTHCTACGGDWGQMLLTGIKELWPGVYDAIPENMGRYAFPAICTTLKLCGVDMNA